MEISREEHRIFIEEQGQQPAELHFPLWNKKVVDSFIHLPMYPCADRG